MHILGHLYPVLALLLFSKANRFPLKYELRRIKHLYDMLEKLITFLLNNKLNSDKKITVTYVVFFIQVLQHLGQFY